VDIGVSGDSTSVPTGGPRAILERDMARLALQRRRCELEVIVVASAWMGLLRDQQRGRVGEVGVEQFLDFVPGVDAQPERRQQPQRTYRTRDARDQPPLQRPHCRPAHDAPSV
jgi:hypothetical protein